jgi:pimeloyl-ACP methyl ester carboxylesterase
LDGWVRRLLAARVAPGRITLVGFSRGGQITALASSRPRLRRHQQPRSWRRARKATLVQVPPIVLGGHLLSIYETTDVVGSCATLAARSHLASFEEVAITTGKKHGAFFQPLPEWLRPLRAWIDKTNR